MPLQEPPEISSQMHAVLSEHIIRMWFKIIEKYQAHISMAHQEVGHLKHPIKESFISKT